MGRYLTQTADKAEELEGWVQNLAGKINKKLNGAKLIATLIIREPFQISGEEYFNGFVGVNIKFDSIEPEFLTEENKKTWYSKMREVAERRFGIDKILGMNLNYNGIDFKESSEENLYALTPNKEATIKTGFSRIVEFVKWHCASVEEYGKVIQAHEDNIGQYLGKLETLVATEN